MTRIPHRLLAAMTGAALLFGPAPLLAHAKLVKSDPTAGSAVAAPKAITLTFNEDLVPAFSSAELVMTGHGMTVPVKVVPGKSTKSVVATPQGSLKQGAYKLTYSVASADGHRMKGEVAFSVK